MSYSYLIKPSTKNKQYIIPDIHGCYYTLISLIDRLKPGLEDEIFFLGDYIDRGPRSKEVLDYVIELKKNHHVYCLRGNHEEMYESDSMNDEYNMKDISGIFLPKYQQFFKELYNYIVLDNAILVHAGINFNAKNPFADYKSMLWHANRSMFVKNFTSKRIIIGHSRKSITCIKNQVANNANVLPLDNGCYRNTDKYRYLCCLELKQLKLFTQPYCD